MEINKIKKLTTLAETKFLSMYKADYVNKSGKEKSWIIASRKTKEDLSEQYFNGKEGKVDAVVVLGFHKEEKKLIIIKQFRVPLNDYIYELPAGLIDPEENIFTTVERELREETGLKLEEILKEKSGKQLYLSAGMTDESVSLAYCICSGEISKDNLEEDEDIETILVSREEAKELLLKDEKFDIKAFMALQSFVALGEDLFKK